MKNNFPDPPILSLCFYKTDIDDSSIMIKLIECALDIGSNVKDDLYYFKDINLEKFSSITDLGVPKRKSIVELNKIIDFHNNNKIVTIPIKGVLTTCKTDIISIGPISEEAKNLDFHPVIWNTSGECFEKFSKSFKKAHKFGNNIFQVFKYAIKKINPIYAAITIEEYLPCLTDIKLDCRTFAFQDFYIKNKFFDREKLSKVKNTLSNYYNEQIGQGMYFSGSEFFNPLKIKIDNKKSISNSVEIAKILIGKEES